MPSRASALPPEVAAVVRPMERRAQVSAEISRLPLLHVRRPPSPKVSIFTIAARLGRWGMALAGFGVKVAADAARGKRGIKPVAIRLREVFEALGGTALKLGQQLAIRVDFLPFEICQELERLLDRVEPFDVAYAIERMEAATGRPTAEDYARIDPAPIGSASIACVFRAALHDGTEVAVKVQRGHVAYHFRADLAALGLMTRLMEAFTLVRAGFFKHLRIDLEEMFLGELDFVQEGNFQAGFRRYVRRDRIRWLDAPRVHTRLSSADVLVTEFVSGYSVVDILRAVETKDARALALLESQDIVPKKVGNRLVTVSFWSRLECAFFHADPHPGNLLVLPGSKLVMLDFGCCSLASRRQAEVSMEMSRRLVQDDIAGGAALSLMVLAPLPLVDLVEYQRRAEAALWDSQLQSKMKDAAWWERTSADMWLKLVDAVREMNVPVTMDVLRMTRATLLYDSVAVRLNPKMTFKGGYMRWVRSAAKRARRRYTASAFRQRPIADRLRQEASEMTEAAARGVFLLSQAANELPQQYAQIVSKGAFAASRLIRFVQLGLALLAIQLVARIGQSWMGGERMPMANAVQAALTSPAMLIGAILAFSWFFLQFRARLDDADPGR